MVWLGSLACDIMHGLVEGARKAKENIAHRHQMQSGHWTGIGITAYVRDADVQEDNESNKSCFVLITW